MTHADHSPRHVFGVSVTQHAVCKKDTAILQHKQFTHQSPLFTLSLTAVRASAGHLLYSEARVPVAADVTRHCTAGAMRSQKLGKQVRQDDLVYVGDCVRNLHQTEEI